MPIQDHPTAYFYLAESDQFEATERVSFGDGHYTAEDALLHAILFFTGDDHFETVSPGDQIRITGPFQVAAAQVTNFTIAQQHLDAAEDL